MLGAIEAGGTKFICAVADDGFSIMDKVTIATRDPANTLMKVHDFFHQFPISGLGIGCFGPLDLKPDSPSYGYIKSTPKLAWRNFDILGVLREKYPIPMAFNTDVNVAAYGEFKQGAAAGDNSCIYLTVGTGIGGGIIIDGHIIHAGNHPELGHIAVKKIPADHYAGLCPYHKDCLEGLASGPALAERCRQNPQDLPADHELWALEAFYLAQALVNYTLVLSPDKIIVGGGVMQQPHLLAMIKTAFTKQLNNYIEIENVDNYLVPPRLGNDSALIGGLIMAKEAAALRARI